MENKVGAGWSDSVCIEWILDLVKKLAPQLFFLLALSYGYSGLLFAALVSGPMLGHTSTRSSLVWLQLDVPGQVAIEYWRVDQPSLKSRTDAAAVTVASDYVAALPLSGLDPGYTYHYQVLLDGHPALSQPLTLKTQPLLRGRQNLSDFRLVLGSCAYIRDTAFDPPNTKYGGGQEIFPQMARQKPDLVLWLGDNVYFRESDDDSPLNLNDRYRQVRQLPELQPLLQTGNHYAIWDDHDYGPNNANSAYPFKGKALELFKRYWPNPSFGLPETPGIFTSFRYQDAEFFLLDDRYWRDADRDQHSSEHQMFGSAQMRWLKNALLASTATFKVVAAGSQLLYNPSRGRGREGWHHFSQERSAFLDWLAAMNVSGLFFLSGDRHFTGLYRYERDKKYPLYELTCSPLTSAPAEAPDEAKNAALVPGTWVGQRNFCVIDFQGKPNQRQLVVKSFATSGEKLWQKEIAAGVLLR